MNKGNIYQPLFLLILAIVYFSCTSEESDSKIGQTYSYDSVELGECAFFVFNGNDYERQEDPQILNLVDSIRPEFINYLDSIYRSGLVMDLPDFMEFMTDTEVRVYGADINNAPFDLTYNYFYNEKGELEINTLNTMFHCEGNQLVAKLFATRTQFQRNIFQGETDFRDFENLNMQMTQLTQESLYGNATTGDFVLMCFNEMIYSTK